MLMGLITLTSYSLSFVVAQNSSMNEQGAGSIEELEKLTSDNILANFSFVESIGNVTESLVNATATGIGNLSSNQTDTTDDNLTQSLGNPTELIANSTQP
jgi:hypothetical protein